MKIIEDKNNELLNRRDVKIILEANKNPSIDEATKIIAKEFKAPEENIDLKVVKGKFGRNTFLVVASIYKKKEDKEKTKVTTKKQRAAAKEAEKQEAKEEKKEEPKPEAKEENKVEEKKEEKQEPKEEKKEEPKPEAKEEKTGEGN